MMNPMMEFAAFSPDAAVDSGERYKTFRTESDAAPKDEQQDEDELFAKKKHIFRHNMRFAFSCKNIPYP